MMDSERIRVIQMDPSRVSELYLEMPKHVFDEYKFTGSEPQHFFLNLDLLVGKGKTPFRKTYKDERVRFDFEANTYSVQLSSDLTRSWTLPLIADEEFEVPPVPKVGNYMTATVMLTVEGLMKVMDDLEDSEDNVPVKRGSDALLNIELQKETKSNYPVGYIRTFVNAVKPLCDYVKIRFGSGYPVEIQAMVPEDVTLKLWCAPRIEEIE
ncbi:MAG: hypothetical protein ACTSSA_12610 [Candidatus Freyarchaeota archaeon]